MRKGIPVSPGVAVGTAFCIHEIFVNPDTKRLEDNEVTAELANFETARDRAAAERRALQHKVEQQVGHEEARIFSTHEGILRDVKFTHKVRHWIVEDRLTAQAALARLLDEYTALFARTNDEYLMERMNDVRDVIVRVGAHLSAHTTPDGNVLTGPIIVVADELLPSQAVALGTLGVRGVTRRRAGHAGTGGPPGVGGRAGPGSAGWGGVGRRCGGVGVGVEDAGGEHGRLPPTDGRRRTYRRKSEGQAALSLFK